MFQSTHPHGVRLLLLQVSLLALCFNPRTRMGCDLSRLSDFYSAQVSIHAPAWGATSSLFGYLFNYVCFNPRTRMGCDADNKEAMTSEVVSIHAPAWGATPYKPICAATHDGFNPRTRMGCDASRLSDNILSLGFNPRTRMGCDGIIKQIRCESKVSIHAPAWGATNGMFTLRYNNWRFNPRTRMGCDTLLLKSK